MRRMPVVLVSGLLLALAGAATAQQESAAAKKLAAATISKQEVKPESIPSQKAQEVKQDSASAQKALELPPVPDYTIGTEDVLAISVWRDPEISRTVPVRPDGKVSLPLIGEVQAKGLTPKQLQTNITVALRSYLANPEVAVIVQEVKSQKFNILGEVLRPGSYPLAKPTTVVDALAIAGGFRDFAKKKKIYILRIRSDGSRVRIPFNYKAVVEGSHLEQNVELQLGDTIIVP